MLTGYVVLRRKKSFEQRPLSDDRPYGTGESPDI